jgi:beta-glucosidase
VSQVESGNNLSVGVSFVLKNSGKMDGDEVVQLYLRDLVSSVVTPEKQLKRFQRVYVKAGEEKTISFSLSARDLALFDSELQQITEPGDFLLMVGNSSDNIFLNSKLKINQTYKIETY